MSADRLREAARVLRERAEAATPNGHAHPWRYTEATYGDPADGPTHVAVTCCNASGVEHDHFLHTDDGAHETSEAARYIATMHPGVALALADWMDDQADRAAENEAIWESGKQQYPKAWEGRTVEGNIRHHYAHPLAVADQILGSAS